VLHQIEANFVHEKSVTAENNFNVFNQKFQYDIRKHSFSFRQLMNTEPTTEYSQSLYVSHRLVDIETRGPSSG